MADNNTKGSKLVACNKCQTKYPSEEFPEGVQTCKKCKAVPSTLKCTYCRSAFQQVGKTTICSRCEGNVKKFGKPSVCVYCSVKAAFVGGKCQRCAHSEKKYGEPITCEHCKQKCAFDCKDDKKKSQGDCKTLCWLCALSYKRVLAKSKQSEDKKPQIRVHMSSKRSRDDACQSEKSSKHSSNNSNINNIPLLGDKLDDQSDLISKLREKADALERQLAVKDSKLLEKDKQITKLQAEHFTKEQEMMDANNKRKMAYDKEIETLHGTVKSLQREVARLKKLKGSNSNTGSPVIS